MSEFLTVTELPENLADEDAVETALNNTLVNDHGLTSVGEVLGEAKSKLYETTGINNRFAEFKPGKERIAIETHFVSGEEWKTSAGFKVPVSLGATDEWLLEEGSWGAAANNIGAVTLTPTGTNAVPPTSVPGLFGNAAGFTKNSTMRLMSPNGAFNSLMANPFSASVWFKSPPDIFADIRNDGIMRMDELEGEAGTTNGSWNLQAHNSGRIDITVRQPGGPHIVSNSSNFMVPNQWTLITMTYDGQTVSLYSDTTLIFQQAFAAPTVLQTGALTKFMLGSATTSTPLSGNEMILDSPRLFDRELSLSEITKIIAEDTGEIESITLASIGSRTLQKSFYPKLNSTTERTIVISNGGDITGVDRTGLEHEYLMDASDGTDSQGAVNLSATADATFPVGFGSAASLAPVSYPQPSWPTVKSLLDGSGLPATVGPQGAVPWTYEWRSNHVSAGLGAYFEITTSAAQRLRVYRSNASIVTMDGDASGSFIVSPVPLAQWIHHALVFDGADIRYYEDAVEATGSPVSFAGLVANANALKIAGSDGVYSIDGSVDGFRIWSRALTPVEISQLTANTKDTTTIPTEPTWIGISSHNTTENTSPGEFNPVVVGRLPKGGEPYVSALTSSIGVSATTIVLDDDIYPDMDPDQNAAVPKDVWITNTDDGTQEKVTITSTPTTLDSPTVDATTNAFPAGSVVSDFPYTLICSNLADDAAIKHFPEASQANLKQSFNDNYEGTTINVVNAVTDDNIGTLPAIAGHGSTGPFVEGNIVHHEREELDGGFENRRVIKEATDSDSNFYSIPRAE